MLNKEYLRVFHLIDKNSLGSYNNNFKILLAQAFFLAGNIEECINTLEKNLVDYSKEPLPENSSEACNLSIIYLLLGKAYEVPSFNRTKKTNCSLSSTINGHSTATHPT